MNHERTAHELAEGLEHLRNTSADSTTYLHRWALDGAAEMLRSQAREIERLRRSLEQERRAEW